jgi:hypothetical protein
MAPFLIEIDLSDFSDLSNHSKVVIVNVNHLAEMASTMRA